ncbi:uncharacterized protein J8A68_003175, partial [[Candida] subhashii]
MLWILQFPPEIIQLIFDGIPLPYLREYLNVDQIGQYAFNSYYASISICDFRDVSDGWTALTTHEDLLGEEDVFSRTYNSNHVYGSLKFPTTEDLYSPRKQWRAPVVYFMNLAEFLDFSKADPRFFPRWLEFERPRDFTMFQAFHPDMISKIERIHIHADLRIDCASEIKDDIACQCRLLQNFPRSLNYLELDECSVSSYEYVFAGFSITHLKLNDVRIGPDDMEFLPTSVKYLTLTNSLILDEEEDSLVLKSPPNLIQLVIANFREDTIVCEVDLSALTKLRYVQ